MSILTRTAQLAAGLGGLLWTVKAIVITARDGSFDPLEGFVFIGGLLAIVLGAVLFAVLFARRYRGIARVAATAGGAVALVLATSVLMAIGVTVVGGIAPGDNLGLEEEGGILVVGLAWLAVTVVASRTPTRATG
jgi:hypothetical protein